MTDKATKQEPQTPPDTFALDAEGGTAEQETGPRLLVLSQNSTAVTPVNEQVATAPMRRPDGPACQEH